MDKKNHNNTYRMKINNPLTSITNLYNKSSNWGKILFLVLLLLLVVAIFKPMQLQRKEGFEQQETFLLKTNDDLYDKFYAEIYDELVFNNLKDDYEVGEIINKTDVTSQSIILDICSKYNPPDLQGKFDIMNLLEDRFKHASSSVVLGTVKVFLHLTKDD